MKLNKHYSINDGKGSIIFSEGNSGTINAEYDIKGNKSTGTFNGILENETLKGTFHVDSAAGLMEFAFSESGFEAKWKKGIEPGPMKGEWKGTLNTENITETKSKSVEKPLIKKEKTEKKIIETTTEKPVEKIIELTKESKVQKEVKEPKNKYVPLTTTKKWQPFLKEVSNKMQPLISFGVHYYYESIQGSSSYNFVLSINEKTIESKYSASHQKKSVITEQNRIFYGLLNWIEFLIKEDYLLIEPIEETSTISKIRKITIFDQYKMDKLYYGNSYISELHPDLIASRKYYPILLRQYLTRLLKKDKIEFDWSFIYVIKKCEPEVYQEFSLAFSELSYEEKALDRYVFNPVSIGTLNEIYKDFLPTLKAFKNKITYTVDDIAKYPEFDFWKDYADKYLKNELKFSDYLKSFFYNYSLRDYRIFDAIFKYLKKNKENFSFHLQNYTYVNLTSPSYTDKELLQRHISLLEFLVESGKSELADELYMEKMEFEKKFPG